MNHIKSINFGYLSNINGDDNMDYLNAMASFIDKNTLLCCKDPKLIANFIQSQQVPENN